MALSGAVAEALSGGLRAAILAAAVARPRGGSAFGGHRDRDVLTGTFALAAVTTGPQPGCDRGAAATPPGGCALCSRLARSSRRVRNRTGLSVASRSSGSPRILRVRGPGPGRARRRRQVGLIADLEEGHYFA